MNPEDLQITRPRVLGVRRVEPQGLSAGDEALLQFGPGLLQFLSFCDQAGQRLGDGLAPEWIIPLGAATTAAVAASREALGWTGVSLSVKWQRPASVGETLLAHALIETHNTRRFGRNSVVAAYQVQGQTQQDLIAQGKIVLISGPAPSVAPVEPAPPATPVAPPASAEVPPSRRSRLAAAVLPRGLAQFLRNCYWLYLEQQRLKQLPLPQGVPAPLVLANNGVPASTFEVSNPGTPPTNEVPHSFEPESGSIQPLSDRLNVDAGAALWASAVAHYEEAPEEPRPDLLRLARPRLLRQVTAASDRHTPGDTWDWLFPNDLFRLLINPLAGGAEPLGRRLHPFGLISLGAALHVAGARFAPALRPAQAEVRCLRPVSGQSDFRLHCRLHSSVERQVVLECLFSEGESQTAQIWLTLVPA